MLHIVQVVLSHYELDHRIEEMRAWFMRVHCDPVAVRYAPGNGITICRVDFTEQRDARAFSDAFDGTLLSALPA